MNENNTVQAPPGYFFRVQGSYVELRKKQTPVRWWWLTHNHSDFVDGLYVNRTAPQVVQRGAQETIANVMLLLLERNKARMQWTVFEGDYPPLTALPMPREKMSLRDVNPALDAEIDDED